MRNEKRLLNRIVRYTRQHLFGVLFVVCVIVLILFLIIRNATSSRPFLNFRGSSYQGEVMQDEVDFLEKDYSINQGKQYSGADPFGGILTIRITNVSDGTIDFVFSDIIDGHTISANLEGVPIIEGSFSFTMAGDAIVKDKNISYEFTCNAMIEDNKFLCHYESGKAQIPISTSEYIIYAVDSLSPQSRDVSLVCTES